MPANWDSAQHSVAKTRWEFRRLWCAQMHLERCVQSSVRKKRAMPVLILKPFFIPAKKSSNGSQAKRRIMKSTTAKSDGFLRQVFPTTALTNAPANTAMNPPGRGG